MQSRRGSSNAHSQQVRTEKQTRTKTETRQSSTRRAGWAGDMRWFSECRVDRHRCPHLAAPRGMGQGSLPPGVLWTFRKLPSRPDCTMRFINPTWAVRMVCSHSMRGGTTESQICNVTWPNWGLCTNNKNVGFSLDYCGAGSAPSPVRVEAPSPSESSTPHTQQEQQLQSFVSVENYGEFPRFHIGASLAILQSASTNTNLSQCLATFARSRSPCSPRLSNCAAAWAL